ncbi:MAG: cytochrome c oxidase subunit 3 [Gammaproteobacteria bacterium]|nr:cytochrome c oxidase subunit 3 [Gammaproteobacteria bacterium]
MAAAHGKYYVPNQSAWPLITSFGLFITAIGAVLTINTIRPGGWVLLAGLAVIVLMMVRWFGDVIRESEGGLYNDQVDRSFRWGMSWFIFSEVMFFAAFFGALYYARAFSVNWIGADDLLWPGYDATWPTAGPKGPEVLPTGTLPGDNQFTPMAALGIPALNTLILLTSGATLTWAHWGLYKGNRAQLITGLFLTVALGISFICLQSFEYAHAYLELGLTLKTGIYGSLFYLLTGFHGFHVTMGTIMLMVILGRALKGHFRPNSHFGFEAVAWYWHFVDVVWLFLFIFIYWI